MLCQYIAGGALAWITLKVGWLLINTMTILSCLICPTAALNLKSSCLLCQGRVTNGRNELLLYFTALTGHHDRRWHRERCGGSPAVRDESAAGADGQVQVSAHPAHPNHTHTDPGFFHAFFTSFPLGVIVGLHLLSAQAPPCAAETWVIFSFRKTLCESSRKGRTERLWSFEKILSAKLLLYCFYHST